MEVVEMSTYTSIAPILENLVSNSEVCFKSQQRGENDLNDTEKHKIATELYNSNKLNFLIRFGRYLKLPELEFFEQFTEPTDVGFEINTLLKDLKRLRSKTEIKNRRYEALKRMLEEGTYFSEMEMMKRNPLLYEQLVGQYMSEDEKRDRDNYCNIDGEGMTLVKILMESIERKNAETKRDEEQDKEDEMNEDEQDSDVIRSRSISPRPSSSRWGEFEDEKPRKRRYKSKSKHISYAERKLLKEEFISTMYKSFINGKDDDFDYKTVDNNDQYVNIETINYDEEEKYFDSEEPENIKLENDESGHVSSEDELDIYMNSLNQHPAVVELSKEMKKL